MSDIADENGEFVDEEDEADDEDEDGDFDNDLANENLEADNDSYE